MVYFEPSALEKLRQLHSEIVDEGVFFRLAVAGGGCSGFQYVFAFDNELAEDDIDCSAIDLPIRIDSMSMQYLDNATVKYVEDFEGSYFTVDNPVASTTCSCGSSFSV
jgi:iron-sulfur cluster insertion protein